VNWPLRLLSEVCGTTSGGTPSRDCVTFFGGGIPWVKSGELRENVILQTEETISEAAISGSSAKIQPPGTLLIAMYGATVGRMATLGVHAATNQAVCALTPKDGHLDPRFLFHSLQAKIPELLRSRTGGAQPNISQGVIRSLKLRVPPLEEQKRIAAILDKADAIRRKRERAIQLADEFLRSLFLDMFGDPVRNPKGWPVVPLNIVSDIRSGVTKGRLIRGICREVPYMRVANVQAGILDLSEIKTILATSDEISRYSLRSGDILLTEGGDPDKLGRGAVWQGQIETCIHQNHIFCVRIKNPDVLLPEYLSTLLGSELGKRYFLQAAKQTTGIASINKTQLSGCPVLLPSIELQQQFQHLISRARRLGHSTERAGERSIDLASRLSRLLMFNARNSVQAK